MKKENILLNDLAVDNAMSSEEAYLLAKKQAAEIGIVHSDHPYANMSTEDIIRDLIKNHIVPSGSPSFMERYKSIFKEMTANGEI